MANEKDFQITIRITRDMRKKIGRYLSSLDNGVLNRNDFINELLENFFTKREALENEYQRLKKPWDEKFDQVKEFLEGFKP